MMKPLLKAALLALGAWALWRALFTPHPAARPPEVHWDSGADYD